jgi:uncharacterized iron-regulated membrane protein
MNTRSLKLWILVHKWTSLICTLFLLMLCLTGLPLIFWHEIEHTLGDHPEALSLPPDAPLVSIDELVAVAREERPSHFVQYVSTEDDEPNLIGVGMGESSGALETTVFFTFDTRSTEVLDVWSREERGVMDVLWQLHYDMYAGLPGTLFLGFMGILFVVSLVSGVVLYAPFMRKLTFGTVRRERSLRTRWLDLHNLLGIAAMLWLLVVGGTGVINTLAVPIFGHWQNTELAAMTAPYEDDAATGGTGSVQRAVDAARRASPDGELFFIAFPGYSYAGEQHFVSYMRGSTPLTSRLFSPFLIDAASGRVIAEGEMPWYVKLLLLSQPLHFGDYGGLPFKILWGLFDIIAIVVLGSGVYLWIKKWRTSIESRLEDFEPAERLPTPQPVQARAPVEA